MASPQPASFATLLQRFRRAAGLTQEELAEKAGLSVGAIGALERGLTRSPHRATLGLLADALGLTTPERVQLELAARQSRHTPPLAPVQQPPRSPALLPVVGRQRELALITGHLTGRGGPLLLISGEPGIGKTRLLQEAATRAAAAGWTVLEGGCHRRSGLEPYVPLVGALQAHLRRLPDAQLRADLEGCSWLVRLLPELAERMLTPLPSWTLGVEQERRLMFEAVGRYLAHAAGSAGALLALDDLQWAGQDALDLLAALVRAAATTNLRFVGICRSTEVRAADPLGVLRADLAREGLARQLELGPLTQDEAGTLLDALLSDDEAVDATLRERVLVRAEGVPFFLVSCAQELRQQQSEERPAGEPQDLTQDAADLAHGQTHPDLPWSVAQSIHQRIALLPDTTRALLGVAAVIGRVAPGWMLHAASQQPEDEVLADLTTACRSGMLVEEEGDTYKFAHDLIREAVWTDLSAAALALYHRRVAEALERQPHAERRAVELAWRYTRAGRPEKAVTYLELAGDQAQAMYAYTEAERYYRDLVTFLDGLGRSLDAARAREKLGMVLRVIAHYEEALATLEQAVTAYEADGTGEDVARALAQLGLTYASRGLPTEGSARLRRFLDLPLAQTLSPAVQASIFLALTQLYRIGGRYREMLAAAESAAARAGLAGDAGLGVRAEQERGTALLMLGRNVEGEKVLEAALRSLEALDDPVALARALNTLSVVYEAHGDFDTARQNVERAVEQAMRSADPVLTAFMVYRRATNAFDRGAWGNARADYERALAMLREVGQSWALPYALRGLGMLDLATGHQASAITTLEDGLAEAQALGDVQVMQSIQFALAEIDMLEQRPTNVIARLAYLLDGVEEESDVWMLLSPLAWAYDALDDAARADALLARAITIARAEGGNLGLGDALRAQALTQARRGNWQAAETAGQEALALYRMMGIPHGQIKSLYVLGRVYRASGEAAQARERLTSALEICGRLGERLYADHAQRLLAELDQSYG